MSQQTSSGGVGFFGLMFLIFLTLKLTGHITWSWWWIFAPLWGPVAVVATVALICGIVALLVACFAAVVAYVIDEKPSKKGK
jgi:hypothetical protein